MRQRCWACGTLCGLPPQHAGDGLFKCGWCAALNAQAAPGAAPSTPDPAAPRLQLIQAQRCRRSPLLSLAGRCLVAVVFLVVGAIFVIGVGVVQPSVFGRATAGAVHAPLAALLAFNVLFNYAACVLRPGGPVPARLSSAAVDAAGGVRRGGLEGCRYCQQCAFYKPAAAHHCRSCGRCVMEMDHHCWYIDNCVGAANLRHFLLFLAWLAAGAAYGLALGLAMGWMKRGAIVAHTRRVAQGEAGLHPALRLPLFSLAWLFTAPPWLAGWAFFTAVCTGAFIGVGMLLVRQAQLLLRGRRYLDTLQQRRAAVWQHAPPASATWQAAQQHQQQHQGQAKELPVATVLAPAVGPETGGQTAEHPGAHEQAPGVSAAVHNVRRVFGKGHPLTWVLPAWDVPSLAVGNGRAKVQ